MTIGRHQGSVGAQFALDTECSETLVTHETLHEIGYQARHGEETATVTSALGQERGCILVAPA
jgi:hypothetical protein